MSLRPMLWSVPSVEPVRMIVGSDDPAWMEVVEAAVREREGEREAFRTAAAELLAGKVKGPESDHHVEVVNLWAAKVLPLGAFDYGADPAKLDPSAPRMLTDGDWKHAAWDDYRELVEPLVDDARCRRRRDGGRRDRRLPRGAGRVADGRARVRRVVALRVVSARDPVPPSGGFEVRKTETSHFWVGNLPEAFASDYFVEASNEDDEDRTHTPLSAFARDQGETWYDHDFLEYGFSDTAGSVELVKGCSYSDQWTGVGPPGCGRRPVRDQLVRIHQRRRDNEAPLGDG